MKKLIGDKQFYKMVLLIAIPIMIQNGITNFVGLLDNMMVGQIGTEQMSGVAIANQLIFVFNLCIFGGISGAGILGAQFYGQGNIQGVKDTLRFKLVMVGVLTLGAGLIFVLGGTTLIKQFLHEGTSGTDISVALHHGKNYLTIMLAGLPAYAVAQTYASTLRETGETVIPMKAGIVAVLANLVLNVLLIFGLAGFPRLGAEGAAIATVIARYIECAIIMVWTHRHHEKNPFIVNVYRHFKVPMGLVKQITIIGTPLLVNEALWAAGMTMLMQSYSIRGLEVVAGLNIANTISNLFNVVFIALGSAVSIIIGQLLGAGKLEEAKETDAKLIFFSVASCIDRKSVV